MDESSSRDSIERVKKLVDFLAKNTDENIDIIVVGGTAMSFYGDYRTTTDIDAEILNCPEDLYNASLKYLRDNKIQFNIDEDFDSWGMVPMPRGYRERAVAVYKEGTITVKTLEPVDFIISKLRRGADVDIEDTEKIISRYNIDEKAIRERVSKIEFIKTEETFWFKQRLERFIDEKIIQRDYANNKEKNNFEAKPNKSIDGKKHNNPASDDITRDLENRQNHKIKYRR